MQIKGYRPQTVLQLADVDRACKAVITAMLNELPREVHSMETFEYTLKECGEILEGGSLDYIIQKAKEAEIKGG